MVELASLDLKKFTCKISWWRIRQWKQKERVAVLVKRRTKRVLCSPNSIVLKWLVSATDSRQWFSLWYQSCKTQYSSDQKFLIQVFSFYSLARHWEVWFIACGNWKSSRDKYTCHLRQWRQVHWKHRAGEQVWGCIYFSPSIVTSFNSYTDDVAGSFYGLFQYSSFQVNWLAVVKQFATSLVPRPVRKDFSYGPGYEAISQCI